MRNARVAALACALFAAACSNFAERYEAGNVALSTGDGLMYSVIIAPPIQQALNSCIPAGTPGASKVLMILADIGPDGTARNVAVEPDSAGTDCLRERIGQARFRAPPLQPGQQTFPIGLRIDQK